MTMLLVTDAAERGRADLVAAAGRLDHDRISLDRTAAGLCDGAWSGTAAATFAEAWTAWSAAADEVHRRLVDLTELFSTFRADAVDCDVAAGERARVLSERLG